MQKTPLRAILDLIDAKQYIEAGSLVQELPEEIDRRLMRTYIKLQEVADKKGLNKNG